MPKNIVVINGSPRENGNSVRLSKETVRGALESGSIIEIFNLQKLNLNPCNACDACRKTNSRGCLIKDDMQIIYSKLKAADAIVISSPVYWFSLSAQTKTFIDVSMVWASIRITR
jgi:multimeric flavodoxin WrbA